MNFIFVMQIKTEVFYKLIPSFWLCITKPAQTTQNKFVLLCSIFRKAWSMKIYFLSADKHITLGMHIQAFPKHPKQQFYNIFAISQGKREE